MEIIIFRRMERKILILIVFFWMTRFGLHANSLTMTSSCQQAEEGKDHTLVFKGHFSKIHRNSSLLVIRDDTVVAQCAFLNDCKNYKPLVYKIVSRVDEQTFEVIVTVNIYNASGDTKIGRERRWLIKQNKIILGSCIVKVIPSEKQVSCLNHVSLDELKVMCWTKLHYPKIKCTSSMWHDQLELNISNDVYWFQDGNFKSNCLVSIPLEKLRPLHYTMIVTIFPDVSNNSNDKYYGGNQSISLNLGYPSVELNGCPEIVEENTEVTCHCERSDSSLINVSIGWFDGQNKHVITKNEQRILKFNATNASENNILGFHCRASSAAGWENPNSTLFYLPKIIGKARSITCMTVSSPNNISVNCKAQHTYPIALCDFAVIDARLQISVARAQGIVYQSGQETLANRSIYTSACIVDLEKEILTPGTYDVLVHFYPNISGDYSDRRFGSNRSVSIYIEILRGPAVIACVSASNVFILILCILVWSCKYKDSKKLLLRCAVCTDKKDNEYDEANDGYIYVTHRVYNESDNYDDNGYRKALTSEQNNCLVENIDPYEQIDTGNNIVFQNV